MSPRISTSEASRRLRDHPANVVRSLSEMVGGLEDCWPELDEGFVETLQELRGAFRAAPGEPSKVPPSEPRREAVEPLPRSEASVRLLDKLERKDKWGGNAVGWDTLRNHYCHGVHGLDEAVDQLVEDGLLLSGDSRHGPYSLNPGRKGEIEGLVARYRARRS